MIEVAGDPVTDFTFSFRELAAQSTKERIVETIMETGPTSVGLNGRDCRSSVLNSL